MTYEKKFFQCFFKQYGVIILTFAMVSSQMPKKGREKKGLLHPRKARVRNDKGRIASSLKLLAMTESETLSMTGEVASSQ